MFAFSVIVQNIFNSFPLAFGQIGWISFHHRLFFGTLQTAENLPSVVEGLFAFYSHSIVNQYNNKLSLNL